MKADKQTKQHRIADFIQRCKSRRLSVTHQRMAVYNALLDSPTHPTAEAVFRTVRQDYPTISLATIYKTLDTLEREGMIRKVSFSHELAARYDANLDQHHHLFCITCHCIEDVHDDQLDNLRIKKKAAKGFQLINHTVQINGLCPSCQPKR